MSVITRQEIINDKWFTWGSLDGMNCTIFETEYKPEESEILEKLTAIQASTENDGITE